MAKHNINLDFKTEKKCRINSFNNEKGLEDFLKNRDIPYKVDIERVKFSKIRMKDLFYPVSKKTQNEFKKFYSKSHRTETEVNDFSKKIKEIEKDISAIWEE